MPTSINGLSTVAPPAVWIVAGVSAAVFIAVLIRAIRRQRAALPDAERMSRLQLIGALAFSAVVVASFVIGTFEGGVAFAGHYLGWTNWRRVIPWGSFDASSMAFSLFAIRAIGRGRSPKRAMRVVYASAGASACVQLLEGGDLHTWQGGAFLAALAVGSTMVVHSVIDQIRGKEVLVGEEAKLRFRKRWLTSFPSTVCAWLAWTNFPPENLAPTVRNALRHLEEVRAGKRARMTERPAWWAIMPWLYASRVESTRLQHVASIEAVRLDAARLASESTEAISRLTAEANQQRARVEAARGEGEAKARAASEAEIERLRGELRDAREARPTRSPRSTVDVRSRRESSQTIGSITSDETIASQLFEAYEAKVRLGTTPKPYWVKVNSTAHSNQAERVCRLLASMHTEANRESNSASPREGASEANDLERELVASGARAV